MGHCVHYLQCVCHPLRRRRRGRRRRQCQARDPFVPFIFAGPFLILSRTRTDWTGLSADDAGGGNTYFWFHDFSCIKRGTFTFYPSQYASFLDENLFPPQKPHQGLFDEECLSPYKGLSQYFVTYIYLPLLPVERLSFHNPANLNVAITCPIYLWSRKCVEYYKVFLGRRHLILWLTFTCSSSRSSSRAEQPHTYIQTGQTMQAMREAGLRQRKRESPLTACLPSLQYWWMVPFADFQCDAMVEMLFVLV